MVENLISQPPMPVRLGQDVLTGLSRGCVRVSASFGLLFTVIGGTSQVGRTR